MKTESPNYFFLRRTKKVVLLFALTAFGCHGVSAQEIVVDPDNDGSTNVVYDDAGFIVPLQNPVTNPLDLGQRDLFVGHASNGTLSISGGASVTNGDATLGYFDGSVGEVRVDGAGSIWNLSGNSDLFVGGENEVNADTTGILNITNGGLVDLSSNASSVVIGSRGSNGVISIDGADSRLQVGAFVNAGGTAHRNANLNITNGGALSFKNPTTGVFRIGGAGDITVDGLGSQIDASAARLQMEADFSLEGRTRLTVANGGQASFRSADVGVDGDGFNKAEIVVDGAGSHLEIGESMSVGSPFSGIDNRGVLTVSNGASASIRNLAIGASNDGDINGTVNVFQGGRLRIEGSLVRQGNGDAAGRLNIGGGTLVFAGDRTYSGTGPLRDVDAVLNPTDGKLGLGVNLEIEGELETMSQIKIDGGILSAGSIQNGSLIDLQRGKLELTASDMDISNNGMFGSTIALETGQHLKVDQTINVADHGRVELFGGRIGAGTLANRGVITGEGRIDGPIQNQQGGKVIVRNGHHMHVSGAGSTNDWDIQMAGGILEFDGDVSNKADGRIAGRGMLMTGDTGLDNQGSLLVSGGVMDVVGDIDNTGVIDVSSGSVATFYDDVINNGTMRVVSVGSTNSSAVFYGEYSGAGDITGGGDVFMLGDLRPGNSPASVNAAANLIFGIDTDVQFELAGLATGEFDQFVIEGDLDLAGNLAVELIDGFLLDDDMEFTIFDVDGDVSGMFNGLAEGDLVGSFGDQELYISYSAGDGNDISLRSFVSVPEPGSAGTLILLSLGWIAKRRRENQAV